MRCMSVTMVAVVALLCIGFATEVVTAQPGQLYALLGVARDASDREIKAAFKKLARKLHPDAQGPDVDPEAARKKFMEVSTAYETLADPAKRKQYDQSGGRGAATDGDDRQFLRHNLFSRDFEGEELKAEHVLNRLDGKDDTPAVVFFWSSNYPDCIDAAPAFKKMAHKMRGAGVKIGSVKCDDHVPACRRLGLNHLPAVVGIHKGRSPRHFSEKFTDATALVSFAAEHLPQDLHLPDFSPAAFKRTCPAPLPQFDARGVSLWKQFALPTSKRSWQGTNEFDFVVFEASKCYDCVTELHMAMELLRGIAPSVRLGRAECQMTDDEELEHFCKSNGLKSANRAWTVAKVSRSCHYATKKPFSFSNEQCGPNDGITIERFEGKYNAFAFAEFLMKKWPTHMRRWGQMTLKRLPQSKEAFATLLVHKKDAVEDKSQLLQWELLSRSVNTYTPVVSPKNAKDRMWAGIVECSRTPDWPGCDEVNDGAAKVVLSGYGDKVKKLPPKTFDKVSGWRAFLEDLIREAVPLHLHVLTPKTYDKKVTDGVKKGQRWFVLFNAGQWCPPCNQIRGPWKEATRMIQQGPHASKVKMAIIECDQYKGFCNSKNIQNYPSMTYFAPGRPPTEFNGGRDAEALANWAVDQLTSRLVTMHPREMQQRIFNQHERMLVSFTAGQWCPPCTALGPVFKKVSAKLLDTTVTQINCDDMGGFCNHFGVDGYPSVVLFVKGQQRKFSAYGKSVDEIVAWARSQK